MTELHKRRRRWSYIALLTDTKIVEIPINEKLPYVILWSVLWRRILLEESNNCSWTLKMKCSCKKSMISAKMIFMVYYKSMDLRVVEVPICGSEISRNKYSINSQESRVEVYGGSTDNCRI